MGDRNPLLISGAAPPATHKWSTEDGDSYARALVPLLAATELHWDPRLPRPRLSFSAASTLDLRCRRHARSRAPPPSPRSISAADVASCSSSSVAATLDLHYRCRVRARAPPPRPRSSSATVPRPSSSSSAAMPRLSSASSAPELRLLRA
ncbi:hypothetical protein PR202_gb06154 [Eleusine coracana subsp. coracana]|uniref:Uncharacterized protein n=1 Tax=Eleusine coracana subsp. coracana TaxID=191504 RepID=A0AAV5E8U1_ELECO|nr:hypothetical protein PR202_gb06154 [Eleusine coracana subsp. coracana]